jgi:hypothetical protein
LNSGGAAQINVRCKIADAVGNAELRETPSAEQIMGMPAVQRRWTASEVRALNQLIEDAVRAALAPHHASTRVSEQELPTSGGRGLRPGRTLDDSSALLDAMDEYP